jgi:processing peptidase subunit beta
VQTGSDVRHEYKSMKECHIALAYEGASWTSEYAYPVMIIQGILGSWDRSSQVSRLTASKYVYMCLCVYIYDCLTTLFICLSRLARDFADNNLVQSYMSFNTAYKDTGTFVP